MGAMILRRLALTPVLLLVIYTITLTLAWAVPGDPLDKPEGRRPPPEVIEAMRAQYNLDSFWSFYWSYLGSATGWNYLRDSASGTAAAQAQAAREAGRRAPQRRVFDLGPSLQYENWRVNEILGSALPVSMTLGIAAVIIAVFIGVGSGVLSAARPGTWLDGLSLGIALAGISLPTFVIGTVLLLVFPVWLGWGAIGRWGPGNILLPALTLSLPIAAYIARLTRMGLLEAMGSDFVRTARAKGLSERRVILDHALPNAVLPVISYLGPATAMAMTGSFVVEKVFNVPGMGQHFVNAVLSADRFLVIGVVMVYALLLILFNLAVDVVYRWVDPRIA